MAPARHGHYDDQRRVPPPRLTRGHHRVPVRPSGLGPVPLHRDTARVLTYTIGTSIDVTGRTSIEAGESATLDILVSGDDGPRNAVTVLVTRTVLDQVLTDRLTTDTAGRATFVDQPTADARYTLSVRRALPYESASTDYEVAVTPAPAPDPAQ